jgi:diacylglycerol kinase family enzyme
MRVTLIHNADAGSGTHAADDLVAEVRAAGHDARYASGKTKGLARVLREPTDVVLVAGGDGTVAKVARCIVEKKLDVPLAILPVGTANNIASTFGIRGTVREIVHTLDVAERRMLDIVTVRAAWGSARFVESAGVGIFAAMLRDSTDDDSEEAGSSGALPRSRGERLRRFAEREPPRRCRVVADGIDLTGTYVMAVAMNTPFVGPNLALAPAAEPGDGRFDLLLVREDDRLALIDYLEAIARGVESTIAIATRRTTHVELEWHEALGHVDDELWPDEEDSKSERHPSRTTAELAIADPPVTVLVPTTA